MWSLSPDGVVVERGASDVTSLSIVTRLSQGPTTQAIWSLSPGGVVVERRSSDVTSLQAFACDLGVNLGVTRILYRSNVVAVTWWRLSPCGVVVERRASYDTSLTCSVAAMKIDK